MKNEYNIFGCIVDSDMDKFTRDDITLSDFNDFINSVKDGDDVTFVFNSPGGSVTSGIAIANKIKELSNRGIKTTAKIAGVCASISTCIACACDKIIMGKGSFFMIHNCWSFVQGDCNTLRKEADLMEKMNKAILSFYRSKFNATDEQLKKWMNEETWISSEDVNDFGLICEVDDNEVEFKIAACLLSKSFNKIPTNLKHLISSDNIMNKKINNKTEEKNPEETKEPTEPKETKEPTEPKSQDPDCPNEDDPEVLKVRIEELEKELKELKEKLDNEEEMVPKKECEKRVSGMQSKMQAKINDFVSQLQVKDEELNNVKAKLTSLNQKLEEANGELSNMASALEEKKNALEKLNAGVLKSAEELPTMKDGLAKCATPKDKVEFLKSGKYDSWKQCEKWPEVG